MPRKLIAAGAAIVAIALLSAGAYLAFRGPATRTPEGVRFSREVPPTGSTRMETSAQDLEMKLSADSPDPKVKSATQTLHETTSRKDTFLANDGRAVTKVKFAYESAEQKGEHPLYGSFSRKEPVCGKTYVAEVSGGEPAVRREDGKGADRTETSNVLFALRSVGAIASLADFLHGREVRYGEQIDVDGKLALELMGAKGEAYRIEKFVLTCKSARQEGGFDCAVFDVAVRLTVEQETVKLAAEPAGEMIVGLGNCWLVSLSLEGPLTGECYPRGPGTEKVAGAGTFRLSRNFQYGKD